MRHSISASVPLRRTSSGEVASAHACRLPSTILHVHGADRPHNGGEDKQTDTANCKKIDAHPHRVRADVKECWPQDRRDWRTRFPRAIETGIA